MNISYLENVATAKESLIIWFSNIEQMDKGIQMFSEENTLDKENTLFGKWYAGEGQVFSSFESFRAIEGPFHSMHSQYIEYIALYNQPIKKSLFSNNEAKRQTNLSTQFEKIRNTKDQLLDFIVFFESNLTQSLLFKKEKETIEIPEERTFNEEILGSLETSIIPEEVEIIKKDIEPDNQKDIAKEILDIAKQENTQIDKTKADNQSSEINIEEEIRRILS